MLISGRQARESLREAGISERRTRIALECGLAGPVVRSGTAHLYDAHSVLALARRRLLTLDEVHERCRADVLVSRRPVRVDGGEARLRADLSVIPGQFSVLTMLGVGSRGTRFIATVAGFVVLGADIVSSRGRDLVLDGPGEWFDGLQDSQLLTGKGRQWKLLSPPRQPPPRATYVSPVRPLEEWDAEIDVDNDPDLDPDW